MRNLPLVVSYVALCTAIVAGASLLLPARPAEDPIASTVALLQNAAQPPVDEPDLQANRLVDRARTDALLAEGRPPVPMLPMPKPVFVSAATADATAAQPASPTEPAVAVLRPPQSATRSIEADGYRGVRLLGREADGRWRAVALRGTTEVAVLVDDQGTVSTQ